MTKLLLSLTIVPLIACGGDKGRDVRTVDLLANDCFRAGPPTGEVQVVRVVDCSDDWDYKVINVFDVDATEYPDIKQFEAVAILYCDRTHDAFLHPTAQSWALGDRRIKCIIKSGER